MEIIFNKHLDHLLLLKLLSNISKSMMLCLKLKDNSSCQSVISLLICSYSTSLTKKYVQRHRRLRKIGSNLTFSKLRKELREGNLRSLLGGSLHSAPTSTEPDPLLFSFTSNLPTVSKPDRVQPQSSAEVISSKENPNVLPERR